ncbi:Response regulator receiver domain-containing protein [Novosphingobium aromaticivorans]|nr:response regulator [Novosphingobium aromaticivorans]SCX86025.1 Response regulator receiver domain-containing protein [Novosphingobium aromaticivorans]
MRVLLVEDEPLLAMLLEENLVDLGHEPVGAAATVAQAMALIKEIDVDCALLDYSLGGADTSVPVARHLIHAGVPFCYLSGHSSLDDQVDAPRAPMLAKPVNTSALVQALENMDRLRLRANCRSGQGLQA